MLSLLYNIMNISSYIAMYMTHIIRCIYSGTYTCYITYAI